MSGMKKWERLKISFAEIKDATKDFGKVIGRGGYGPVYEGQLFTNGKHIKVAVKRLNEQFGQGLKEFLTEIQLLSGQQHENIITLVGYCDEGKEKIIVYEYAEHGSLDRYIRLSDTRYALTWLERLTIVFDAARGLDHLHNHLGEHQSIIHRDIKSSNILLDHKWVGKISDLGLSKLTVSGFGRSTVISQACGTQNYLEPEYIRTGLVNKKTDVYSFGMVLFEVLCGRLCYARDKDGILLLAEIAKEYYVNDKLDMIIDPALRVQMSPDSLRKFSTIAYKCLQKREQRPLMDVVKKELEETLKIQIQHEEAGRSIKSLQISCEEETVDDEYWMKKLPNRYQRYIQRSDKPLHYNNKKELYFCLCKGFLCDNGQLWFSMSNSDNWISSMLPATRILRDEIEYEHLDTQSLYESRFHEAIILGYASSYSFTCTLQLQMFSPQNMYACYLVFKFEHNEQPDGDRLFTAEYGFGHRLLGNVRVHMNRNNKLEMKPESDDQEPETEVVEMTNDVESWMEERKDGWMEVMLTKPLGKLEDHSTFKVRLSGGSFGGIIVEGIEFRPYII
ncbi:hypothetical protein SSX86_003293 [Deinandra increscens subsp. villosa]|uniref:Protein kinase domain-containing protein n=1 Tax=Deinandra increscens subsp. villosa TaxID=3103831 RepID=A0AAP0DHD3_9ASTR